MALLNLNYPVWRPCRLTNNKNMDRVKRIWYLSPMRAAKVQASMRIRAVSPEPSLLAHTSSESRGTFRQKARSLAPLNDWACAVKICHDGMLEDTNSLDGAHILSVDVTQMLFLDSSWKGGAVGWQVIWAASWQSNKMACSPSEDSDQPGHAPSLVRVFAVRVKKTWVLSYPLSAQRRLWSDLADAQADLCLRWAHMPLCWFCHEAAHITTNCLSIYRYIIY